MSANLWAVTMIKDEADVIEATLRHVAAQGVDGIIVADNGSTDGTQEIIRSLVETLPCLLQFQHDADPGYWQSQKMTRLADEAYRAGAAWVWPFDADEIWTHVSGRPIADALEVADAHIVHAPLWNYYRTAIDADGSGPGPHALSPFQTMQYRMRDPQPMGKVIVRWAPGVVIEQGNHAATHVGGWNSQLAGVQVRHFPYRSEEQFVRKAINGAAAYAATDLPWEVGMHWREYGLHYERGGEEALREIYRAHFFYDSPTSSGLVYDPARIDS